MTLSRLEQTNRRIRKAALEVNFEGLHYDDEILETLEEHMGWDLDDRERLVALEVIHTRQEGTRP